jgi:N-acetylmuramic acid 6-phosphate etherase
MANSRQQQLSITETSSDYDQLEDMEIIDLLTNINHEDHLIPNAVKQAIPAITKLVEQLAKRFKKGGRLFYIGAGTSGRLGVLDASEIPPTFGLESTKVVGLIAGGDTALRTAVEEVEDNLDQAWIDLQNYSPTKKDTLVGIAASGTTKYVLGGIVMAKNNGLLTAGITNNPGSPLAQIADIPIEVNVGPEFVTGSTRMKSGTSQKLVLNMITTSLMIRLGRIRGNKMVDMQLNNVKLLARGARFLVDELNLSLADAKELLVENGSVRAALAHYNEKKNLC